MGNLILQKIKNKKVLNACLLVGIAFLVAVLSCTPMFQMGSLDMLLQNKLKDRMIENNEYPFVLERSEKITGDNISFERVSNRADEYVNTWERYLEIDRVCVQKHIWVTGYTANHLYGKNSEWLNIGCVPEFKEHVDVLAGTLEPEAYEEGIYPCFITERIMDSCKFVEGDRITFSSVLDENGRELVCEVVGIIKEKNEESYFWHKEFSEFDRQIYVDEATMTEILDKYSHEDVNYEVYDLLNFRQVKAANISLTDYYIGQFHEKDAAFSENITDVIDDYYKDKQSVNTICWVLELPIVMLLLAFIYMIVNQILSMENGEIAMLVSRGFKRKEIVKLYLGQSLLLSVGGLLLGLPLGYGLCKLAASTNGFLEFAVKDVSSYHFRIMMLPFAVVACALAVICIIAPVAYYAKYTTVERKTKKNQGKKSNTFKWMLELLVLLLSIYLLFNYKKQKSDLAMQVMTGQTLDPLVFLNVTLFLFVCGLIGLGLLYGLIRVFYALGRRRWKPHTYVALLQIMRGDSRSRFITVFLIFTISMGIVDANVAGTININNQDRLEYDIGADLILKEQWVPKVYMDSAKRQAVRYYEEPDFQKYEEGLGGLATNMTRVVRDDNVIINASGKTYNECFMLAVNTKEFGETSFLKSGLNDEHWFNLLNTLAVNPSGILISDNLARKLKVSVGDSIKYSRINELMANSTDNIKNCSGIVCGIFKAWPGYDEYSYGYNEEGEFEENETYGIIVNYAYEVSVFGDTPYEVWINLKDGRDDTAVISRLNDMGIKLAYYKGLDEALGKQRNSAMIQITNGLFTLSFIISLVLCTIGFLIYWITSIKKRELLLGIYRAMGMSFKEANKMLVLEQVLSSIMAGILGGLSGMLASLLHIDVLAIVYLPQKHNIALRTVIDSTNLLRFMLLLVVMVIVCLLVMRCQIRKLNMVQAIKMGED